MASGSSRWRQSATPGWLNRQLRKRLRTPLGISLAERGEVLVQRLHCVAMPVERQKRRDLGQEHVQPKLEVQNRAEVIKCRQRLLMPRESLLGERDEIAVRPGE